MVQLRKKPEVSHLKASSEHVVFAHGMNDPGGPEEAAERGAQGGAHGPDGHEGSPHVHVVHVKALVVQQVPLAGGGGQDEERQVGDEGEGRAGDGAPTGDGQVSGHQLKFLSVTIFVKNHGFAYTRIMSNKGIPPI